MRLTGDARLLAGLAHALLDLSVLLGDRLSNRDEAVDRHLHREADTHQRPQHSLRLDWPLLVVHQRCDLRRRETNRCRNMQSALVSRVIAHRDEAGLDGGFPGTGQPW